MISTFGNALKSAARRYLSHAGLSNIHFTMRSKDDSVDTGMTQPASRSAAPSKL